ncbi:MAG: SUMF1/EgtB/PvdO family nonheme iron enzyme [Phycisphaerales bacterium]
MVRRVLCCAAVFAAMPVAVAQTGATEFDFVTVGAPGNQGAKILDNGGVGPVIRVGAVKNEFRVSRHEVTRGQWLEFIDAQRAFLPANVGANSSAFTGRAVQWIGNGPDGLPAYQVTRPDLLNTPVIPSWEFVARYMNWLHNGKKPLGVATAADFETGAYTMANFGVNEPVTRNADARFFIMDMDEWTKAVYYDPNRYGEGQGGYWMNPGSSDDPLTPGAPGVGQTSAGWMWSGEGFTGPPDVGAYGVETPWGLLDASGGAREWLEMFPSESIGYGTEGLRRPVAGSSTEGFSPGSNPLARDVLGEYGVGISIANLHGFRVAAPIHCADANGDGFVNFADLNAVLAGFGQSGEAMPGDVNRDGVVDFVDLNEVLGAFGTACE